MRKQENPAKAFLRQYRAVSGRVESLRRVIAQEMERAQNTGLSVKEIKVLSSPAEHDPMAANICRAIDATVLLQAEIDKAAEVLRDILISINSLSDERQKEILTRRYIEGQDFKTIMEEMHYEKTQVYVLHGRALVCVNQWLKRRANNGSTDIDLRHHPA